MNRQTMAIDPLPQNQMPDFILSAWYAWIPGLTSLDNRLVQANLPSTSSFVPKMLHRRLSPLAKAVFHVTELCLVNNQPIPAVFSSAHGEISKSLEMLRLIQAGQELSPTAFSLSVHNAIAGLFSIAFNNKLEITVLAPGQEGIAPAFIEAIGLLHEGADEVLLMLYDEPISDFYPTAPYQLNSPTPCVLGLRIGLKGGGMLLNLSRSSQPRDDGEHPVQLLAFVNFLLDGSQSLVLGNQGHSWTWHKH